MEGPKPVARWVGAWVCALGAFLVMAFIFGVQPTPEGFQIAGAQDSWTRLLGLLLAAAVAGAVAVLVAWHDVPGLGPSAMGLGLVLVAQIGRSMLTDPLASPSDYWPSVVTETLAVAVAMAVAHGAASTVVSKLVGLERREALRREVRVGRRRTAHTPAGTIFLVMGGGVIAAIALAYLVNGGEQGEGAAAICAAATALVVALLMHRAAPIRESLWFALSVPLWAALLPAVGWVLVQATGDETLPLAVAMASVGTSPFAFCGAGVVGAMIGLWISYGG